MINCIIFLFIAILLIFIAIILDDELDNFQSFILGLVTGTFFILAVICLEISSDTIVKENVEIIESNLE